MSKTSIILTFYKTKKGKELAETFRKANDEETQFNRSVCEMMFSEEILSENPLVIKMTPKVRLGNISFLYLEIKCKIEKMGGVLNQDFKVETKTETK